MKHLFCILALLSLANLPARSQTTAFTYQGRLNIDGIPYTGQAEFQPTLWADANGGSVLAANLPAQVIAGVTNGLFVLPLDFGPGQFPGVERWLQFEVRTNLSAFTLLAPRQQVTPTPYAFTADHLASPLPATQLSGSLPSGNFAGTYSGAVNFSNAANNYRGDGANLTGLNASQLTTGTVPDTRLAANVARLSQVWQLGGNAGTTPGAQFLGTTDDQPLEFMVNGLRVLRFELNGDGPDAGDEPDGAPNVIAGSAVNSVGPGVVGATISGGGATNIFQTARPNIVLAHYGTVGGGWNNTIQGSSSASTIAGGAEHQIGSYSTYSAIGGGRNNFIGTNSFVATIAGGNSHEINDNSAHGTVGGGLANNLGAGSVAATIAGGQWNDIGTNALSAVISGGHDNHIGASAWTATIGGGRTNHIATGALDSVIGGGFGNTIDFDSLAATIAGGQGNTIAASSYHGTIGGGLGNSLADSALYGTIPGGVSNRVTNFAFAAGRRAKADHVGAFVWADSQNADFPSQRNDQFRVRVDGGARFDFNEGHWVELRHVANVLVSARIINTSSGGYLSLGGAWVNASDRARKTHFTPVDPQAVLAKVTALPLSEWSYRNEGESVRHVGPMAQDFHATFGLGGDDKSITTVDANGVALAAIQGLNQKLEEQVRRQDRELQKLRNELAEMRALLPGTAVSTSDRKIQAE